MYRLENKSKRNYLDRNPKSRRNGRTLRNNSKNINSFHIYLVQILFCVAIIALVAFLKQINNPQINEKLDQYKQIVDNDIDKETLSEGVNSAKEGIEKVKDQLGIGGQGGMFDMNFDPSTIQSTPKAADSVETYLSDNIITPVKGTALSSAYGVRTHPITGKADFHTGVDLAQGMGQKINAALAGEVKDAGKNDIYGNYLLIKHANGVETFYGHCKTLKVKKGQEVKQGQQIATVGSTGMSTGPHLHFEVRVSGKTIDPMKYLDLKKTS